MSPEEIEMQLWEFIDDTCNNAERQRISLLITTDDEWKAKYTELASLHQQFAATGTEQPSLRFTQNVMDIIARQHPAPATRKYINKFIVGGIAAFFILSIVCITTLAFMMGGSQASHPGSYLNLTGVLNQNYLSLFIMVNILISLVLIDTLLRRRLKH